MPKVFKKLLFTSTEHSKGESVVYNNKNPETRQTRRNANKKTLSQRQN